MHPSLDHYVAKQRQAELTEQAQGGLEAAAGRRVRRALRRRARAARAEPVIADVVAIPPRLADDDAA